MPSLEGQLQRGQFCAEFQPAILPAFRSETLADRRGAGRPKPHRCQRAPALLRQENQPTRRLQLQYQSAACGFPVRMQIIEIKRTNKRLKMVRPRPTNPKCKAYRCLIQLAKINPGSVYVGVCRTAEVTTLRPKLAREPTLLAMMASS